MTSRSYAKRASSSLMPSLPPPTRTIPTRWRCKSPIESSASPRPSPDSTTRQGKRRIAPSTSKFVPGARLTSKVIHEQLVQEEFAFHVTFAGGDVEIVDMVVGPQGAGLSLQAFEQPDELRVVAVTRERRTFIPSTDFVLAEGDVLAAAARARTRKRIMRYIADT